MPPLRKRRSIKKTFQKYRLEIARAIIRNDREIASVLSSPRDRLESVELCDDYAVTVLVYWLCTRSGANAYSPSIDFRLDDNPLWRVISTTLQDEYPLANVSISNRLIHDFSKAYGILESNLEPDLTFIGSLFEQIADAPLIFDGDTQINIGKDHKRRLSGQFYTPAWIVKYCFNRLSEKDLKTFMNLIATGVEPDCQAVGFKFLDPACGTGNFLLGAIELFRAGGITGNELIELVGQSIYGIELDGRAACLARLSLVLALRPELERLYEGEGKAVLERILSRLTLALRKHIVVSDSIMAASIDSRLDSFNLVMTNPPYISFGARNQRQLAPSAARYLRASYPETSEYKIRFHSIFQEIAVKYAGSNGRVILFLPDAFLTGSYYQRLRRKLLKDVKIESLTEFPDGVLDGATVGRWCVASYITQSPPTDVYDVHLFSFAEGDDKNIVGENDRMPGNGAQSIPAPDMRYKLPLSVLVSPDRARFRLVFDDTDRDIWLRLDSLPPLSSCMRGHTGMRARCGQASIVADSKRNGNWRKGLASGALVTRHAVRWDGSWLNVDPPLLFAGGYEAAVVEQPKLMVRQTADRLIAGFDRQGFYHLNNIHSLAASGSAVKGDEITLRFFEGLLNSSFWLYLYQSKSREAGRALAQIDIEMLESLPVPQEIDERACTIAAFSRAASALYLSGADLRVDHDRSLISLIERSIDRLVYDLYDLSPAQVARVEALVSPRLPYSGNLPDDQAVAEAVRLCAKVRAVEATVGE